ncbi:signal recognition particle-docking protein FtsY [Ruminococcus sp. YRD2003]|nr:signal recognition particle-docking protein FtsY [Ruminococcus flavefaciens]
MGIFSKIAQGLKKTKDSFIGGLQKVFNSFTKIDEELFEQLEEQMIMSDIGVDTSVEICDRVRKKVKERGITDPQEIMELIHEVISEIMGDDTGLDLTKSPAVIMVIGVNGAGKTTTIGKMCHQFKNEGKKVLVAAADTFRAAAIDQLQVWTERAGVEIVKHAEGSDPGAVVYDALDAAKARGCDVVIIDTAGRLHNKKNLMEELKKINRIIDSKAEDCSREVLLVLDATTGQNAVSQAKLFSETAPITGIVLTKLDGTAKGGIVISIKNELGIPVKLIGVGEKIDDLQPFDSRMFVDALFDMPEPEEDEEEEETAAASEDEEAESSEYEADNESEEDEDAEYDEDDDEDDEDDDEDDESDDEDESGDDEDESDDDDSDDDDEEGFDVDNFDENAEFTARTEFDIDESFMEALAEEKAAEESDDVDDDDYDFDDDEADDEADEDSEDEVREEAPAEPEKKKKKGFFSRLFGRKDDDEEDEDDE